MIPFKSFYKLDAIIQKESSELPYYGAGVEIKGNFFA